MPRFPKLPVLPPFLFLPLMAGILFFLHTFQFVDFHENDAVDMRFRLRGEQKADPRLSLVLIDDASLAAIGQWPWPRSNHAVLLDVLSQYHPRAIFFDVLFTEASPQPADDEKLQYALKKAGNVVLPFYFTSEKLETAYFPIPALKEAAHDTGYVNVFADPDGQVRKFRPWLRKDGQIYFHPAVLIKLMDFTDQEEAHRWLEKLPVDSHNDLWINFPGTWNQFKKFSFSQIIQAAGTEHEKELESIFKDGIIFIGHAATGTTDLRPTPFQVLSPGVVAQASAMHTLLTGRYLRSFPPVFHLLFLIVLACFSGWVLRRANPGAGLLITLTLLVGYFLLNFAVFYFAGWILPVFVPLAAIFLSYIITLFIQYVQSRFERQMLAHELQMAAQIQEYFLPRTAPDSPRLQAAFQCRFTKEVGGDLYDWSYFGNGRFGFCVGDVSGKGMPAAIYMSKVVSDLRAVQMKSQMPGDICSQLNQVLAANPISGMFLTLFYILVDIPAKKLFYVSAGHDPALFYDSRRKKIIHLKDGGGLALGMFEESAYETGEIAFEAGDAVLLYSDGVREVRNPKKEEFGLTRLGNAVSQEAASGLMPKDVIPRLFDHMRVFQEGQRAHDDSTLLFVKFL